jgi:hypothetical protein
MPRSCSVCEHDLSHEINVALVQPGASNRRIASQYGLTERAIRNHRTEHIPELLLKASQATEVARADELLAQVEELRLKAMGVLEEAEEAHDHRTILAAIDRASKQLELLARLLGELNEQPVVNLHISPEWVELRTAIVVALEPHPDARDAVVRAIEGVSNGKPG